jgi:hypothetical protein
VSADEGDILAGSADPDLLYQQIIRPWKSRLALLYLEHRSIWMDLRILLWTAVALVSRRRALDRTARLLDRWQAGELLSKIARRAEPLVAYPAPGSDDIVLRYAQPAALSASGSAGKT